VILASTLVTNLAILVLAGFIGFVVISRVPNTLHTPLMSGTNAIHGIVLLGGLLIIGLSGNGPFNKFILVIAIAFGTINIVGGFLVTDRMLEMFKSKPAPPPEPADEGGAGGRMGGGPGGPGGPRSPEAPTAGPSGAGAAVEPPAGDGPAGPDDEDTGTAPTEMMPR
jgi:NAD(P) transhydrogenase subunit alpha